MSSRLLKNISVLALVLVSASCASKTRLKLGSTDKGEVVEAIGYAPYDGKDMMATKRASLVDAQKNAVEKVVGVYVSGRTMVEKAVAIENNILAKTEGYVRKFDVVDERKEGDMYRTKIRALVALKDLEADLKELSMLQAPLLDRPRAAVKMTEMIEETTLDERVAQTALEAAMGENGFQVAAGTAPGQADILITGKVVSMPFQTEGLGGFVSNRARLSAQVMRINGKDVLFSLTKEASGLGGSRQLAGYKSLETVGQLAGQEISKKLSEKWGKAKSVIVMAEHVASFAEVERFRKHLSSEPGISDLTLRLYDEQTAQFEVILNSLKPSELAARLESSQSFPLKVLESSDQIIRVQMENSNVPK